MKLKTLRSQYMILASQSVAEERKEIIESDIKSLGTGKDVMAFIHRNPEYSWSGGYGGDVIILKWRGIDVAVFYKRQVVRVQPDQDGVNDGTPARALRTEDEAWTKMSLLEVKSSMKQAQFYSEEYMRMKNEVEDLRKRVRSLEHVNDMLNDKMSLMKAEKESKSKSVQE